MKKEEVEKRIDQLSRAPYSVFRIVQDLRYQRAAKLLLEHLKENKISEPQTDNR